MGRIKSTLRTGMWDAPRMVLLVVLASALLSDDGDIVSGFSFSHSARHRQTTLGRRHQPPKRIGRGHNPAPASNSAMKTHARPSSMLPLRPTKTKQSFLLNTASQREKQTTAQIVRDCAKR